MPKIILGAATVRLRVRAPIRHRVCPCNSYVRRSQLWGQFLLVSLLALPWPLPLRGQSQSAPAATLKPHLDAVPPAPLPADLDHAIALAASYLERACSPGGKFVYQGAFNGIDCVRSE